MTQPAPQQFKSARSGRLVVPGWMNLVPGRADGIEIQLDVAAEDLHREQASLLIEYWATPDDLTLQSVLPVRAFPATAEGWCAFVPPQGRVLVRAIDPQPNPPVLASHWINVDPATPAGTTVNVAVKFPVQTPAIQSLLNH
ncbi:uracil-DNA glycosylase [Deinococcus xianganensis]|uniref:Uracil-DNA glycosylase n=1 Tax=Deinococcus xianganensis TaxID=1507289 RepID=A0A6I4YII8_9DEIO|nr:uracil-DNA glycosylase [Deinococcus xianganensis]MXV19806.1 uracil-DNA glycosylase [Deinococcus xianganensis]